jgi:maltose alpha-D-glucosyltransferase/alpha-amylase
LTLEYLEREIENRVLAATADTPGPADPAQLFATYLAYARKLGERTGELHRAFAVATDDPAFAHEPIGEADLRRWVAAAESQAAAALAALAQARPALAEADAALAERVLAARETLRQEIRGLAEAGIAAAKTRVHGDYHLGQVLVARDDFYILDFEGEPARPIEERRAKLSPLKDVAGMLRSFDYAAWTVADRLDQRHPGRAELIHDLARAWRRVTGDAFLATYTAAMAGAPSLPEDPAAADRLLRFHLVEKALYEICYEAANRPRWLRIPLGGVAALLDDHADVPRFQHGSTTD